MIMAAGMIITAPPAAFFAAVQRDLVHCGAPTASR